MFSYRVYRQIIHINIALSLPSVPSQVPNYTVVVQKRSIDDQRVTWIHDYEGVNGIPWHRLGRLNSAFFIRFTGYADFIYEEDENLILCYAEPNTGLNTIEHLLLDQVLPRILSRTEFIALHSSAIVCSEGALGFVGETGSGKSTMTTMFGRHGYSILTDDCLVIKQENYKFWALPSYPAIRLNPDVAATVNGDNPQLPSVAEYSAKLRLTPAQGGYTSHANPEVLRALFILDELDRKDVSAAVVIERCSMRDAFGILIGNVFRLDPTDKIKSTREFKKLNILIATVPVYRLKYMRTQSVMSEVICAITDLLQANTSN